MSRQHVILGHSPDCWCREAEALARRFHEAYERLAPSFGYETRRESAVPWEEVPQQNRDLMVAVAGEVLLPDHPDMKRMLDECRAERDEALALIATLEG
jgi:hypothetical protein